MAANISLSLTGEVCYCKINTAWGIRPKRQKYLQDMQW